MAADILIYQSNLVPVGQDQKQHIEVTRDIAVKFNHAFAELLTIPEPYILDDTAVVPGTDGQKMSKSYDNTIDIFGPEEHLRKRIMSVVTDSARIEDPKDPEKCNAYALCRLFIDDEEAAELADQYRAGGVAYGDVKKRTAEAMLEYFGDARQRRAELSARPDDVHDILREGGRRARAVAQETMARARQAAGITTHYAP
jgi:tryptophanyl-tRNA synthetase